jgi:hypothetical protein
LQRKRNQMFLRERLQHLLIAQAATDFLPAPPVESCFIAVDSGHIDLLRFESNAANKGTENQRG